MEQKTKGISLIVLVITIIIIIILAGAVILSLSNSNVINKAKSGVMQTDIATIKEQIKTKMAENELNNVNVKIGTQLWDSFYTMSVSQLQEIGISAKNDCIYDYNTGSLSVKQNNDYVTPEELYGASSATNYIDGYVQLFFGTEEITDAKIAAATTPTIKAALQQQQFKQKYTNGEIKVHIYDINLFDLAANDYDAFLLKIKDPLYQTETTGNGYFLLNNITVEAGKSYSIGISNMENTVMFIKTINFSNYMNKTLFTKSNPLKLLTGDFNQDLLIDGADTGWMYEYQDDGNIKVYDLNKNGQIQGVVGNDADEQMMYDNFGANADDTYTQSFN